MAITHFSCLHGTMYMAWLTQMSTIKSWWWILLKSINPIQHRHDVWHHALCQNLCWHGMSNRSFMSYVFQRLVLGTWHKMSTTQWPWDRMHLMKMIGLSNYKRRTMPRKAAQSQPAIKTSGALNKNCPPPIHSEHTSLYNCCLCNLITRKQMLSNHNYHHQMLAEETLFFFFSEYCPEWKIPRTEQTTTLSCNYHHSAINDTTQRAPFTRQIKCNSFLLPHHFITCKQFFIVESITVVDEKQGKSKGKLCFDLKMPNWKYDRRM